MKYKRLLFSLILFSTLFSKTIITNANITSWGYQLQNFTIEELSSSSYDLLVIDYSFDGSDEEALSASEIGTIQSSSKTVISYISIGEAEDYRFYFDNEWLTNAPIWFDQANPDWEGNYKVKFWDEDWQSIIYGYLDKIMSANFNGVYLDIIDAYEFYLEEIPDADQRMIDFVLDISEYCKIHSSFGDGFMIIPQNGEALLVNSAYRNAVDGIGREDVYVLPDDQSKRQSDEILKIEDDLDLLIADGKNVFVVDYTKDPDLISYARSSALERGYISYIGTIELDDLLEPNYSGTSQESPFYLLILFICLICGIIVRKLQYIRFLCT